MGYEMAWNIPGKVLHLKMSNSLSFDEFIEIDKKINEHLQEQNERITLIVDGSAATFSPYSIERIKPTQKYLNSYQISQLIVVGSSKVNRLAMLLLFNLCRPKLQFCDTLDQAQRYVGIKSLQ